MPDWVKLACCAPSDIHRLPPEVIHLRPDGYHIDGIETVVPEREVLPSQDGYAYGFWNEANEPKPIIYCMFLGPNGV